MGDYCLSGRQTSIKAHFTATRTVKHACSSANSHQQAAASRRNLAGGVSVAAAKQVVIYGDWVLKVTCEAKQERSADR